MMISGWSTLQVPLRSEGGAFALAPPSIGSKSSGKEQSFSICKGYGDRGGLERPNALPELKASLVENLVGALINATEILDEYAHPSCMSAAFKSFLGFETLSQHHSLALMTGRGHAQTLPHGEPSHLLSHEGSSHGSSVDDPISSDRNMLRFTNNARALHSARSSSSSALRSENISWGHRDLSANTIRSADHGDSHHSLLPASSEEDILLQEARFKAFRNHPEGDEWKGLRQASASSESLMKIGDAQFKQAQAKDVSKCNSHKVLVGHAEPGKSCLFADFTTLSQQGSLFWGGMVLSMFLAGAFLVTHQLSFFMRGRFQRPSLKRRILKSQWYGNPGSQSLGHRNFQMRISEFPKYQILEVDGDKQQLRSPANISGTSAVFAKSGSHLPRTTNGIPGKPIRQTTDNKPVAQISGSRTAQEQPIRQTVHGSKALPGQQHMPGKAQSLRALHGKAFTDPEWSSQLGLANDHYDTQGEGIAGFSLPRGVPMKSGANGKVTSHQGFSSSGLHGRGVSEFVQETVPMQRSSRMVASKSRTNQNHWGKDDELDLDRRIQKLYETIQAVEQHRRAAMIALEEERQRSMALEGEMAKQREASAVLGEEVRLLKESHSALLTSLRKKYSTSAAVRTAADLVYQDWERHAAAE